MKVYIRGQSTPVDLTQRDYVGEGGEGQIFQRNGVAFKVYFDPAKMIPVGKIQELAEIKDLRVIKPERVLQDSKGKLLGYTMRFVKGTWALCQIFPRVFRDREGVTPEMINALVRKMQEGVLNVHHAGVLLVDLNEMNFLVSKSFDDVFFIDADSYQTKSFPATALMPSVRDWKTPLNHFTENSDWYSFGIVTFQMFCGIHPYKGKYHKKTLTFEERMQQGISVFNPNVGIPAAAYPVDVIPPSYRQWYEAVFEKGVRCAPPVDFGAAIMALPKVVSMVGTKLLEIVELGAFDGPVRGLWSDGQKLVVATDASIYVDNLRIMDAPKVTGCAFSPRAGRPVVIDGTAPIIKMTNLESKASMNFGLAQDSISYTNGRAYIKAGDRVHEIVLMDAGDQVIPSSKETAQVLEHASQLFPGVIIQKLLGTVYVHVLPESGKAYQMQIPELDSYRIIDAKFDGGVLMVVGLKRNQYDRLVFRFDLTTLTYEQFRKVEDIQPTGLNFVTLDSGVCISLTEEEKIEMFSSRPGSISLKVIEDPAISGDVKLAKHGGVVFAKGNKVFRMKMK